MDRTIITLINYNIYSKDTIKSWREHLKSIIFFNFKKVCDILDGNSVIPLKHSGGIQMYLAKSTGPVYMGVEYGVFGKFRFMTQSAYDALGSYDEDTIYFVRSS